MISVKSLFIYEVFTIYAQSQNLFRRFSDVNVRYHACLQVNNK